MTLLSLATSNSWDHCSRFVAKTMLGICRVITILMIVRGSLSHVFPESHENLSVLSETGGAPSGVRLNFSNAGLTNLTRDFFKSDVLTELTLDDNQIETLSDDAFEYLPNLCYVSLANNKLKNITLRAFVSLKHLQVLNLNSSIDIFAYWTEPPRIFDFSVDLPRLTHFYLADNYLGGLSFSTAPWRSLTHLSLSGNILADMDNETWRALDRFAPRLKNLYLEMIGLRSFDLGLLPNLILVDLGNNYMDTVCNNKCKGKHFFKLKGSGVVRSLLLNRNYISEIDTDAFDDARNLQVLDLSRNCLGKLRRGMFDKLNQLTHLYLSGNQLLRLGAELSSGTLKSVRNSWSANNQIVSDCGIFGSLTQLRELSLSDNSLTIFPPDCLPMSESFAVLDLSNNELERIFLGHTKSLRVLNIKDNPLTKVNLKWLADISQELDIIVGSTYPPSGTLTSCH